MGTSADAALDRAFALAFFFHPDRRTALLIATQAAGKLRLAERAQVRRGYYRPIGRRAGRSSWMGSRTKVSVERSQLLQRLVLHESEAIERASESNAAEVVSDDELALRFVKHLVRSSSQRNSLYVAVAIGRILHGYQTAEVLDLLSTLAQDPERVPEDSYLRHVKGAQIREIKERFGGLLRTETGPRGEEFIVAAPPTPSQRLLVNRALELLTPWDTACPVPSAFDAMRHTLKALRFAGENPDDEHAIEVNRMHSLIHPECFHRLATGLRLESPADRLRIPKPFRSSSRDEDDGDDDGVGATNDRARPPRLSRAEVERHRFEQSRLDRERKTFSPSRVALRVDGRLRLTLEAQVGARAVCTLTAGAEVMEAWGRADGGGEALLAVHVLRLPSPSAPASPTGDAAGAWEEVVVPLRGGRELVVTLTLRPDPAVGHAIELVASCRASSLAARWLARSNGDTASWWQGPARPIAAVSVLLAATGLAFFVARWREPVDRPFEERPPISAEAGERTRGRSTIEPRSTTLANARLLYLDLQEGAGVAGSSELLRAELEASGRFDLTSDIDAAHAALKGALAVVPPPPGGAAPDAPPGVRLELSLVDERGEVLWSTDASGDSIETVTRRAVADLVARAR